MVRHVEDWGVAISFLSALFTSAGLCLQKLHIKQQSIPNTDQTAGYSFRSTLFIAGICYVGLGLLLKIFYYVMIPQILIAILSAQTVIYTTIFEYLFLNIPINFITRICIIGVVIGTILSLLGVTVEDETYSFTQLWEIWISTTSILFTIAAIAMIIVISYFFRLQLHGNNKSNHSNGVVLLRLFYRILVCGLIAGWFGILFKAVCEVTAFNLIQSDSITFASMVWFMLLLAFIMGILKMRSVTLALREFQSWQFLPLYQSAAIFFNAICGLIYFKEFPSIEQSFQGQLTSGTYFVGLTVTCLSIAGLLFKHKDADLENLRIISEDIDGEESAALLWENSQNTQIEKSEVHEYVMRQGSSNDEVDEGISRSNHGAALAAAAHRSGGTSGRTITRAGSRGSLNSKQNIHANASAQSSSSGIGLIYGGKGSTYQILRGGVFYEAYGEDDVNSSNYYELHDADDECEEVHFNTADGNNSNATSGKYQI